MYRMSGFLYGKAIVFLYRDNWIILLSCNPETFCFCCFLVVFYFLNTLVDYIFAFFMRTSHFVIEIMFLSSISDFPSPSRRFVHKVCCCDPQKPQPLVRSLSMEKKVPAHFYMLPKCISFGLVFFLFRA